MVQMDRAAETDDREDWLEADVQFHDAVFATSGNQRAINIIQTLNDQKHRVCIGSVAL
jgi:DNA-binding GntR family transcriptional regulator